MTLHRVFVYGSLKCGFEHHAELTGARLERLACTAPGFRLVDCGRYPALVRAPSGVVYGEVHVVDSQLLARLDAFEDVPRLYQRERVRLDDGSEAWAWLKPAAAVHGLLEIAGGRFQGRTSLSTS